MNQKNIKLFNHTLKVLNYLRSNNKELNLKNVCLFSLYKFNLGLINDINTVDQFINQINKMQHIYEGLINKGYKKITVNKIIIESIFISSGSLAGEDQIIKIFLNSKIINLNN